MTGGKRKCLCWLGVLLLFGGGFVGLVFWLGAEEPISPSGFARLREGMTRTEMQRILGPESPPDRMFERNARSTIWRPEEQWGTIGLIAIPSSRWGGWEGERYSIEVIFDDGDRALLASLYAVPGAEPTVWQRLRRWVTGG